MKYAFELSAKCGEILATTKKKLRVGCFMCQQIFPASEVDLTPYLNDHRADILCPRCNMNSLIPDVAHVPLTETLLQDMLECYREETSGTEPESETLFYELQQRHFKAVRSEDADDIANELLPMLLPPEQVHVYSPDDLANRYDEMLAKADAGDRVIIARDGCHEAVLLGIREYALYARSLRMQYYEAAVKPKVAGDKDTRPPDEVARQAQVYQSLLQLEAEDARSLASHSILVDFPDEEDETAGDDVGKKLLN
ncbi:hypothetical protein LJC63_09340 [Ruminococcaceae bacterium OttesenSCG-928-L11]|nr:hypothetical protein [Ruminococcaceae bacterium OttesenSCG-928-L11]